MLTLLLSAVLLTGIPPRDAVPPDSAAYNYCCQPDPPVWSCGYLKHQNCIDEHGFIWCYQCVVACRIYCENMALYCAFWSPEDAVLCRQGCDDAYADNCVAVGAGNLINQILNDIDETEPSRNEVVLGTQAYAEWYFSEETSIKCQIFVEITNPRINLIYGTINPPGDILNYWCDFYPADTATTLQGDPICGAIAGDPGASVTFWAYLGATCFDETFEPGYYSVGHVVGSECGDWVFGTNHVNTQVGWLSCDLVSCCPGDSINTCAE